MVKGKITKEIGAAPEKHEQRTTDVLALAGFDVVFLVPIPGQKTPDIKMSNLKWEIKCPKGKGKHLIHNTVHRAAAQSSNIIVDLYRIKIPEAKVLVGIVKYSNELKNIKRVKVIDKSRKIIDLKK
ncbi:hypothetical protein FWF48_01455 [Candidatus Saccharibacteria bacterium]|nr:hypothetical protein [Candidatus Saccharibacteria bacterium]